METLESLDERAGLCSEVSAESCADHSLHRKLTLKSQTIRNRLQVIERFKQKPAHLTSTTPVIPQTSADAGRSLSSLFTVICFQVRDAHITDKNELFQLLIL